MHPVHLDEQQVTPSRAPVGRRPGGTAPAEGPAASLLTLQQAVGNRAVAAMVSGVQRTVQRCGPGSDCGCSPEEQAKHAASTGGGADHPVQRHADEDHED